MQDQVHVSHQVCRDPFLPIPQFPTVSSKSIKRQNSAGLHVISCSPGLCKCHSCSLGCFLPSPYLLISTQPKIQLQTSSSPSVLYLIPKAVNYSCLSRLYLDKFPLCASHIILQRFDYRSVFPTRLHTLGEQQGCVIPLCIPSRVPGLWEALMSAQWTLLMVTTKNN